MPMTPPPAPFPAAALQRPARWRAPRARRAAVVAACALLLAACGSSGPRPVKHYDPEAFDSTTTHTRTYGVEQGREPAVGQKQRSDEVVDIRKVGKLVLPADAEAQPSTLGPP